MKYDNLRLCNDYIADMEKLLDEIAALVGVSRGDHDALIGAIRKLKADNATLIVLISEHSQWG